MRSLKSIKISNLAFSGIIAELMWISRETLDRDRLLNDDEYLEKVRRIFDRMGFPIDYLEAEKVYIEKHEARERRERR